MIIASNWPTSDQIERRQKEGRTVSAMPTTTRRMGNVTYGEQNRSSIIAHSKREEGDPNGREREDNAQKFLVRMAKMSRNLRMSNL